jgi:hypothetical protein
VAADGTESFLRKMLRDSSADELLNLARRDGAAWAGGRVFRRGVIRRREAIVDSDFLVLMELMSVLAVRFGDANVRVVVFFD